MDIYRKEISRYYPLTADEERSLVSRIRGGDRKAREALINANQRIVISVANKYRRQGVELLDLINEGNTGLLRAVELFDEQKECRFITYAVWWIRQAIYRSCAFQAPHYRLPGHAVDAFYKMTKTRERFEQRRRRSVSWGEIAEQCRCDEDFVSQVFLAYQSPVSFDCPIGDGDGMLLSETIADGTFESPENLLSNKRAVEQLRRKLLLLEKRERTVLQLCFGIGKGQACTLKEIGKTLNISSERVRQIKETALRRLRKDARQDRSAGYSSAND